jgi:hypothetical protein
VVGLTVANEPAGGLADPDPLGVEVDGPHVALDPTPMTPMPSPHTVASALEAACWLPAHGEVVPTPITPTPTPQALAWVVGDTSAGLEPALPLPPAG